MARLERRAISSSYDWLGGADPPSRLARFAARFSCRLLAGFFFPSLRLSNPLLMVAFLSKVPAVRAAVTAAIGAPVHTPDLPRE
jgi:hypothetical protein